MADKKDMGLNERDSVNRGGKPVQLLSPAGKGYDIIEEEIERIFGHPDVANTPVAIYSIAGAFRTGKSFMLTMFLRFLWAHEKNKSKTWLTSQEEELVEGFAWRGGADKHTPGIWVWNKPFFFKTPQHGKVALFLLDTEGAFDHTKHTDESSIIFSLSTLLSSVQIYNVHKQIQGDTLEHLQLLTDYAKTAKQSPLFSAKAFRSLYTKYVVGKQENKEKAFQNLMFLVRDWSDPDYDSNFEGGQKILDKFLQSKSENTKIESVRKNLRESFENISCCLMKRPGDEVCERGAKQGSKLYLKDVRREFLETIDILVKELFSPKKIIVKRLNGNLVKGKDFINFVLAYFKIFSSGEMPELGTMLQTAAKAVILQCIDQCKNEYRSEMQKKLGEGFQTEEDLQRNHHDLKSAALLKFDQTPKLGDEELIAKHKNQLGKSIELELLYFQEQFQAKMELLRSKVREAAYKAREMYKQRLKEESGGKYVGERRLQEIEQKSRNESLKQFENETSNLPLELVDNYKPTLHGQIDIQLKLFEESNAREGAMMDAFNNYKTRIDAVTQEYKEEGILDELNETEKTKAIGEFNKLCDKDQHETYNLMKQELIEKINRHYSLVQQNNEHFKVELEGKGNMLLHENKAAYLRSMKELCDGKYVEPAVLRDAHDRCKREAHTVFASNFKESASDIKDEIVEEFNTEVEKLFEQLQSYNKNNKNIFWRKVGGFIWGTIKGPFSGLVSGVKRGFEIGNERLGPVIGAPSGAITGAVIGAPSGAIGGLLTGGASEVEKVGAGFKPR